MAYLRDPDLSQRQMRAAIAEIKADPEWMNDAREQVKLEIVAERVSEQP